MNKKILILNGSPRLNGNTSELIRAFSQGAQSNGNTVTRVDLQTLDLHPCLGCCKGGKNPSSPCVQKDGMEKIYPLLQEADLVVFASPLYFWTISGQLKCAIDRLFALAECTPDLSYQHKDCVLLMAAEGDGFEESVFWYDRLMGHIGWTDRGKVLCGGVLNVGDIQGNPKLEDAFRLGASL